MARIVFGKQRRHVHVEGEDVANRILVLDAAQSTERIGPTRIRPRRCRAVERGFQMGRERVVGRLVRTRLASGRHHPSTELANDLFPRRGIARHTRDVERIEGEPPGRTLPL